jgi:hypothetical protein
MQHQLSLTPATQAVLDALRELGHADVNELADKTGRAVSTVHRALKTLFDAGLISEVDTGTDPVEGIPARWALAEGVLTDDTDSSVDADPGDDDQTGGNEEYTDVFDTDKPDVDDVDPTGDKPADTDVDEDSGTDAPDTDADQDSDAEDADKDEDASDGEENDGTGRVTVVQPSRPGDRKVMTIKMVLAEHGDNGATMMEIVAESGVGETTVARLLTAMERADAARRLPGSPRRWIAGPTKASEVDPNPQPPRCPLCFQVIKGLPESPEAVTQVMPLIRADGTLHVVAEDGTTHVVTLPQRMPTHTMGFTTAGAAHRPDPTVNTDGSQPLVKGELERLTLAVLTAQPGRTMTPQEIATAISAQLDGRTVSSGAVRNNCTKLAATGRIVMVSEVPWAFQYPAPAGNGDPAIVDNGNAAPAVDGDATGEQS